MSPQQEQRQSEEGAGYLGELGLWFLHAHLQSSSPASLFEVTTEKGGGHVDL